MLLICFALFSFFYHLVNVIIFIFIIYFCMNVYSIL